MDVGSEPIFRRLVQVVVLRDEFLELRKSGPIVGQLFVPSIGDGEKGGGENRGWSEKLT